MQALSKPFVYTAEDVGYGAWIHWVSSGAHFYSYFEDVAGRPFFSVDAYTCKPFDVEEAVKFTREYFDAIEIVYKDVEV